MTYHGPEALCVSHVAEAGVAEHRMVLVGKAGRQPEVT